ncbi:MAG: molybdopterin cofactor-binding domain-containing protein [Armatimonadota bacterium]
MLRTLDSGSVVASGGNLTAGTQQADTIIENTFLGGYLAHAPIETHTALAEFKDGQVTVWASTQSPFGLRNEIAQALRLSASKVRVITPFVGGGFGGKSEGGQGVEAAKLSKIVGKPVQVARTREEEFLLDRFRPAAAVKIRSGYTKAGKIVLWDYTVLGVGDRGAPHFYDIPHHRTRSAPDQNKPLPTGPWRGPGNNANTFARESQIDIMAAKLGIDPVQFRLNHLTGNQRMHRTLEAAAKQFGWEPKPAPSGRGWGVALGIDAGTCVATIVQVEVDRSTGRIRVPRVVCAQDMGFVVNPEGAIAQIESCVNMGMGYTLFEERHFNGPDVLDRSFAAYRIPTFSIVPEKIEAVLVDAKDTPSQGGGEPAIITVGAAVANAVFDATGARLYQLPMTPERVLEALAKAEPVPAPLKGDLNGDGKLTTDDALLAVQIALGLRTASSAQTLAGDVNLNGALDLSDATRILRAAVGKEKL